MAGSLFLRLWPQTPGTTATCHTLTTTPTFTVTTLTARPQVICPFPTNKFWLNHRCPLMGWRGGAGEGLQGKRGPPSTAVNTLAAARPIPRVHTSKLTFAPTQVHWWRLTGNLSPLVSISELMQLFVIHHLLYCLLFRGKALPMPMGGLQLEICPLRWVDPSLPEAHGPKALRVSTVSAGLFPLRPSGSAHEETHLIPTQTHTHSLTDTCIHILTCMHAHTHCSLKKSKAYDFIMIYQRPWFNTTSGRIAFQATVWGDPFMVNFKMQIWFIVPFKKIIVIHCLANNVWKVLH